jgi:hypothetical protein
LDLEKLPGHVQFVETKYSSVRPIVNLYQDYWTANAISVGVKSEEWAYEKEWRMVLDPRRGSLGASNFPTAVDMPPGFISGVILGARITSRNRKRVFGWIKILKEKPRVYESFLDDQQFRIDRRELKFP